jgi:hypothetical protein
LKETFEVGKIACTDFEPALSNAFSGLRSINDISEAADAQIVLLPRFIDVGATTAVTAFSNRELIVILEWTVKDASGKTIWIETVTGSSKHHIGNMFTYRKNVRLIIKDSVRYAAQQSAGKMTSSLELRKLAQ